MKLLNGYEMQTTFWEDFSIADMFGEDAIKDTFNRAFKEWKSNYIYLTELVIVMNLKLWEHHKKGNSEFSLLYNELWEKSDEYACENLKGNELSWFYKTTD